MGTWIKCLLFILLILVIIVTLFAVVGYSVLFLISLFHITVDFSFLNAVFAGGATCVCFSLIGGIWSEK
jgi:flagellar basal body-associated protein FliL